MREDYIDILNAIRERRQQRMDDGWVTIKGTHVLLGAGGVAMGGGKLKGMTFSNAKSTSKAKSTDTEQGFKDYQQKYAEELKFEPQEEVERLDRKLTTDEIVEKIGGPDGTEGSCMSLAFAYASNEAGYDVVDFRGGYSRGFFAQREHIKDLEMVGVKIKTENSDFDYADAEKLIASAVPNKEYILVTGRHAAVIRKTDSGKAEYLELQNYKNERNGWKEIEKHGLDSPGEDTLRVRFGCNAFGTSLDSYLIDVDSLKKSTGFNKGVMSYICNKHEKENNAERYKRLIASWETEDEPKKGKKKHG